MAEYEYLNAVTGQETKLTFSDFVTLVKGASITSLAASDDFGFIEFGLSDAINLRITNGNRITLMPTTNEGDEAPVRLSLIEGDETPTAKLVESRIHALRQVYAIDFLLNADRESEISVMLSGDGPYDIESLLNDDDKLLIKSASTGSFWLTLAAKSSAAWSSLKGIAPLFFDEGRQASRIPSFSGHPFCERV